MITINPKRYDRATRWLHTALAAGVIAQLLLSAVMTVPAGRGLGTPDWHREAFELHAKTGLFVAFICACHWVWICLPRSRPGYLHLFPWLKHAGRVAMGQAFSAMLGWRLHSSQMARPLVGTIHGLGLLAVSGSALCGLVNYLGYFLGVPIPRAVLHGVGLVHIACGHLIWAFVVGHVAMAAVHGVMKKFASADHLPH